MKKIALILLAAALLLGCRKGEDATRTALMKMQAEFPAATVQDVYKSFFQNHFGPGHLITDTASVRAWSLQEIAETAADSVLNPYFEPTGADGRYIRVYLRCVNEGKITADQLLSAFFRSAQPVDEADSTWTKEWAQLAQTAVDLGFPAEEEVLEELTEAAHLNHAVRHSDAYRNAYHPHYRIIERRIFEEEIAPLLNAEAIR